MAARKSPSILLFSISLTGVFFLLSLVGILHHEIWMDEAHSFLLARESVSLQDLFSNAKQEGHPLVWYILLWGLNLFTKDVFYMQLLHILISSFNVFLIAYYGPFNKIKTVLLAFSYYFFFEYNILSRNYGLCLLFVTLYLIQVTRTHKNYTVIAVLLALLANTHFLGLIISGSLVLAAGMLWWSDEERSSDRKSLIQPVCIVILAYVICILYVMPDEASMFSKFERNAYFSFKRWSAWTIILKGLFQFPYIDNTSWNTNIFTRNKELGFILTLAVSVIALKAFINRPLSFVVFWTTVIALSLFFYLELMHVYAVRHWGFVFIGFYAAIWLAEGIDQSWYEKLPGSMRLQDFLTQGATRWRNILFYAVLIVQVAASAYMFVWDYQYPFCNAKTVAGYIKENKLDRGLIIVSSYSSGIALNAYVGNREFYYPEYHGFGTYGIWSIWPNEISSQELINEIQACENKTQTGNALLVLNDLMYMDSTLVFTDSLNFRLQPLAKFEDGFSNQDKYALFLITYKKE